MGWKTFLVNWTNLIALWLTITRNKKRKMRKTFCGRVFIMKVFDSSKSKTMKTGVSSTFNDFSPQGEAIAISMQWLANFKKIFPFWIKNTIRKNDNKKVLSIACDECRTIHSTRSKEQKNTFFSSHWQFFSSFYFFLFRENSILAIVKLVGGTKTLDRFLKLQEKRKAL